MVKPDTIKVRTRAQRWTELRDLLTRIDALCAMNLHIDILHGNKHDAIEEAAQFERDRDRVYKAVQRELTNMTVDALNADLKHRMLKDSREKR